MPALPSLRQLRYLVTIAERLSFTRAAADCFVTQSTLSAGIKELEETLGARLVERDRRSVLLTPLGQEVVLRARALLAQAGDLAALAARRGAPMTGMVRLGAIPTIAPFLLPAMLPVLREQFPSLRFALREDLTAHLVERLESGSLDIILVALPYETGSLLVRPLFDDEFWLVGPHGDPALRDPAIRIAPAVSGRLLLLEDGHCLRDHAIAACRRSPVPREGLEATSLLTLLQMVEAGMGLALIPELAIRAGLLQGTHLVARPLAGAAPKRVVALAARPTTIHRAEIDAVAAVLTGLRDARRSAVTTSRGRHRPIPAQAAAVRPETGGISRN
jgi:LysR family hydrogen peroxide-inducible transcriptional activator